MTGLKLPRLPDRTPVKLTISVPPDIHVQLGEYAELYRQIYGDVVAVTDLIPAMLSNFLAGDREFLKARKDARKE